MDRYYLSNGKPNQYRYFGAFKTEGEAIKGAKMVNHDRADYKAPLIKELFRSEGLAFIKVEVPA